MSYITAEVGENVSTITLNDERRRNALSHALVKEAIAALGSFREAKSRAVILRARQGVKVFSSGHDVSELPESRRDPLGWDDPLRQLVREIENFPCPVIAMVEGRSSSRASGPPSLINMPRSERPIRTKISDSSRKTTTPQTAADRVRVTADKRSC